MDKKPETAASSCAITSTQLLGRSPLCLVAENLWDTGAPVFSADEMRGHKYAFIWWEKMPTPEERAIALPCISHGGMEINFPPNVKVLPLAGLAASREQPVVGIPNSEEK